MKGMVTMFRDSRAEGARDLFSCSIAGWRFLQELAVSSGWNPLGTTYVTGGKQIEEAALRD
ncbi:MAG TPA: hypothetical protein VFS24_10895 [Steroidobacteraceae bacterium]|nr:hypothetical protein [Steroidobacteraceae bacterium]